MALRREASGKENRAFVRSFSDMRVGGFSSSGRSWGLPKPQVASALCRCLCLPCTGYSLRHLHIESLRAVNKCATMERYFCLGSFFTKVGLNKIVYKRT
jgi:hypothetical protein